MSKSKTPIYRIKVTLRYVAPPIWRRIEVPADVKLGRLHRILQVVMGWTDSHLHAFRVGRTSYGVPNRSSPATWRTNATCGSTKSPPRATS